MALTIAEFREKIASDRAKLQRGEAPEGVESCFKCSVPLQESITGNRAVVIDGARKHACSDCYFEEIGSHIDEHPIFMPRLRRG